ncbi:MAG: 2-phospho-L-lactate transferase [Mycobacteriales bacterium]
MIVVLAGGIGAARFLRGLLAVVPADDVTVIGNTGDDITLHGLRVCPDLDTLMYTFGGGIHEEQGWGRADERFTVAEELAAYGEPGWFTLGDRDLATHLVRTTLLADGVPLSEVTRRLCQRWAIPFRLLPMTDAPVETQVVAGGKQMHFQEYWVGLHAAVPVERVWLDGTADATPAPGVVEAISGADVVLLPPSNPVVSIGTILDVPGIRAAIESTPAPVVGISPIIGGAPVRGMADKMLAAIGVDCSAYAVARHYGGALLDGWLVDTADASDEGVDGVVVEAHPLWMSDVEATAAIAKAALLLAERVRG